MHSKADSWEWTTLEFLIEAPPYQLAATSNKADGIAWMSLFSQNMLEIASEIATVDPSYADMAFKFAEHFLMTNSGMIRLGNETGIWDEEDGFFYDVLRLPNGISTLL